MEKGTSYPEKSVLTTVNEHDRNQLEVMVNDKECMYVFDHGYLNYASIAWQMTAIFSYPELVKT